MFHELHVRADGARAVKEIFANSPNVNGANVRAGRYLRRLVEVEWKLVILGEVVEGSRWENRKLDSCSGDCFDRRSNRSVAAGDENPLRSLLYFLGNFVFQLVGLNFMNVERARG